LGFEGIPEAGEAVGGEAVGDGADPYARKGGVVAIIQTLRV
jgi:hypothetical protein